MLVWSRARVGGRWLSSLILAALVMALLGGCGEADNRRFPNLPADHPKNQKVWW